MRRIRYSKSFLDEFANLLEQGVDRFGPTVVAAKRAKVLDTIRNIIARHPKRTVDADLGLCAYQVQTTQFVVLYDYDEDELRIHLVIHASTDRTQADMSAIVW
jgi:plasmid stabilization system protein ParE